MAQVAKVLGINDKALHTWIAKYSIAKTINKPERTDEHLYDELKRLRKDVARLNLQRHSFGSTQTGFAKE